MERLKQIFTPPNSTVKQALRKMDHAGKKILLVTDRKNRLLGTVTDGDIRRWILKNGSLKSSVTELMNKRPLFLNENYSQIKAREIITSQRLECLPVLNADGCVTSSIWWMDFLGTETPQSVNINLPVVIMAGGEGTRLGPITKILPKPLMPIGDKTILQRIMEHFFQYGCSDFFLSLNYKANLIKAYFGDLGHNFKINYVEEKKPLGTAGSLHMLKGKIKSTFFLSNCDIIVDADYSDILDFHKKNSNFITLVASMKHYTIPYGVCSIKRGGELKKLREKPEYDFLVNTGMYALEPEALKSIPANKFLHITDLITRSICLGKKIGVYPISEKSWIDTGQIEELQETLKRFGVQ